jgi:hypothetical protein
MASHGRLTVTDLRLPLTTHVVRLKLFRLKAEGTQKTQLPHFGRETVRLARRRQQIFASNIASKCAIFPLFLTVFSLST